MKNTVLGLTLLTLAFSSATDAGAQDIESLKSQAKLIYQDNFDREESDDSKEDLGPNWVTNTHRNPSQKKQADLVDGYLQITKSEDAVHGVSVRHDNPFDDGIVMAKFRLHDQKGLGFHFNDPNCKESSAGHICRVGVTPTKLDFRDGKTGQFNMKIRKMKKDGAPSEKIKELMKGTKAVFDVELAVGQWYELTFLVQGDQATAWIDGKKIGEFRSPGIDHPVKYNIALSVWGERADVDELRIWSLDE
ncbi:MAG: family 16 glycoside hydrolase [Planctomycetota bacterium]